MLRFDLNVSILLREVPFLERFERAASLGFGAVEFWCQDLLDLMQEAMAAAQGVVEQTIRICNFLLNAHD